MKNLLLFSVILFAVLFSSSAQNKNAATSGNPVFPGWYADPECVVLNNTFWIFPTWSAKYKEQVFLDAFSSPDLSLHPEDVRKSVEKYLHLKKLKPT